MKYDEVYLLEISMSSPCLRDKLNITIKTTTRNEADSIVSDIMDAKDAKNANKVFHVLKNCNYAPFTKYMYMSNISGLYADIICDPKVTISTSITRKSMTDIIRYSKSENDEEADDNCYIIIMRVNIGKNVALNSICNNVIVVSASSRGAAEKIKQDILDIPMIVEEGDYCKYMVDYLVQRNAAIYVYPMARGQNTLLKEYIKGNILDDFIIDESGISIIPMVINK